MTTKDFFVSYQHNDESWAEWIAWQLEEAGYSTVVQAWDFRPGTNFVIEMDRALRDCARIIAVLSSSYISSQFTLPEWAGVFARDPTGLERRLVPVKVAECEILGLLAQIVYIDLCGLSENAAKEKLLAGVSSDRPKRRPPFPGAIRTTVRRALSDIPAFPPAEDGDKRKSRARRRYLVAAALVMAVVSAISTYTYLNACPTASLPVSPGEREGYVSRLIDRYPCCVPQVLVPMLSQVTEEEFQLLAKHAASNLCCRTSGYQNALANILTDLHSYSADPLRLERTIQLLAALPTNGQFTPARLLVDALQQTRSSRLAVTLASALQHRCRLSAISDADRVRAQSILKGHADDYVRRLSLQFDTCETGR